MDELDPGAEGLSRRRGCPGDVAHVLGGARAPRRRGGRRAVAGQTGPRAGAGNAPFASAEIAAEVLGTAGRGTPPGDTSGIEAAAPVRLGGAPIGALCCRWPVGTTLTPAGAGAPGRGGARVRPGLRTIIESRRDTVDPASYGIIGESPVCPDCGKRRRAAAVPFPVLIRAKAAAARNWWPAPSTTPAPAASGGSARSIAPPSQTNCSRRSCSATRRGDSRGRGSSAGPVRGGRRRHAAAGRGGRTDAAGAGRSCSGCCRRARSGGSGRTHRAASTSASWRRRTGHSRIEAGASTIPRRPAVSAGRRPHRRAAVARTAR